MKIPKDKLPLKVGNKLIYGQYSILCKYPNPTEFQTGKYAGQIAYKDLSQYVVKVANKFPGALEILKDAMDTLTLCTLIDKSSQSKISRDKIEQFLNSLEDEK